MRNTIFDTFDEVVSLERCVSTNAYNERSFSASVNMRCRIVQNDTIVKNASNEDVSSKYRIYTKTKVNDLDKVNGQDVLRIKEHKSLYDNEVIGYTVFI